MTNQPDNQTNRNTYTNRQAGIRTDGGVMDPPPPPSPFAGDGEGFAHCLSVSQRETHTETKAETDKEREGEKGTKEKNRKEKKKKHNRKTTLRRRANRIINKAWGPPRPCFLLFSSSSYYSSSNQKTRNGIVLELWKHLETLTGDGKGQRETERSQAGVLIPFMFLLLSKTKFGVVLEL